MTLRIWPLLAALALAATLAGCVSQTRLVTNDKASEAVKAKSFKAYTEVLLIPPKEDPRQLVPRVADELRALGFGVSVVDPGKPVEGSQGTGFVIGAEGWLLTCAHVIGAERQATITLAGERLLADVVQTDVKADLALLKLRTPLPAGAAVLGLREAARPAVMGEDVFTIGYPLSALLGNSARMSKGLLSATAGLRDDPRQLQVSAEIQPGNSGGPLLDREGRVLGVINQTINPAAVAKATGGALPQNINFAIKVAPVRAFVASAHAAALAALDQPPAQASLEQAAKAVAKVQAGLVMSDAARAGKLVVRLDYNSHWDLWYRFRSFVLAAFDFETREPLFIVGQGRDNVVSNEDVVIRDTLAQFRKAIAAR